MAWIDEISVNNFNKSFNLKNILTCSVFYPCAGIDASDIELLGDEALSYVHSDLNNHFQPVGYNLIGLKKVALDEFHQFIFWGVFELRKDAKQYSSRQLKKIQRFSILHIHDDDIKVYGELYLKNKISPIAIFDKTNRYSSKDNELFKIIVTNNLLFPKYISTYPCGWLQYNQTNTIADLFNHQ